MSDLDKNLEKVKAVKPLLDEMPITDTEKAIAQTSIALGANPVKFLVSAISQHETEKAEKESSKEFQNKPEDYKEIESIIHDMLTESTGTNIMDSGGAYGRNWQRNRQITDFRQLPDLKITVWKDGDVELSLNIFHYLTAYLETDETTRRLEEWFEEFCEKPENQDTHWLALMEEFSESMSEYGFDVSRCWNSYNWENLLSQVLQGVTLSKDHDEYDSYWILQIHNGCDVRGGYTKPRIFHVCDRDYSIIAQNDVRSGCNCGPLYSDDGGYHWYDDSDIFERDDDGLPKQWIPEPKTKDCKNWEYQLRCEKCSELVTFWPMLEY